MLIQSFQHYRLNHLHLRSLTAQSLLCQPQSAMRLLPRHNQPLFIPQKLMVNLHLLQQEQDLLPKIQLEQIPYLQTAPQRAAILLQPASNSKVPQPNL